MKLKLFVDFTTKFKAYEKKSQYCPQNLDHSTFISLVAWLIIMTDYTKFNKLG